MNKVEVEEEEHSTDFRANPNFNNLSLNYKKQKTMKILKIVSIAAAFMIIIVLFYQLIKDSRLEGNREEISMLKIKLKKNSQANQQIYKQINSLAGRIQALEKSNGIVSKEISTPTQNQIISSNPYLIDLLHRNAEGKTIDQVLYNESLRVKRKQFYKQRIDFVNAKTNFQSLNLIKYNMKLDKSLQEQQSRAETAEWLRLENKFKLSTIKEELPMCIVTPGYNNNANFRIEFNLNSIFTINYTNYHLVLINDASTDGSGEIYKKYFQFYNISKDRYTYIENVKRVTALQNIYIATTKHCRKDSIVVTLDADDQFIGKNTLKLLNYYYQTKKSGVVYSNFYWYQQPSTLMYGFTSEYTDNQKKTNAYRGMPMKFSHLRSYRTEIYLQIDPKDFKDKNGNFYTIAYDMAMFFPLMELSCGRVNWISGQFNYLYNVGTGLNDYNDRGRQVAVDNQVRGKKKYECYKDFDQKMKK